MNICSIWAERDTDRKESNRKKGANHSCNRADTRNGILSGKSESCICGFGRSYLVWSELSGMVSKKIYGEKWEK